MEYERASSLTFSTKPISMIRPHNSNSFGSTAIYDGVFSTPSTTKPGSSSSSSSSARTEDYLEIFQAGSGSSIPVLDVPELEERRIMVDVKSSQVDYQKIFGGFGDGDDAEEFGGLSYEQLFDVSKEHKNVVERRSSAQDLRFSNQSAGNQKLSDESNGVKEFKMSYHKTDMGSKIETNGMTHVAQLNAVPGYTYIVDELRKTEERKAFSNAQTDDLCAGKAKGGNYRKAVPDLSTSGASQQTSKSGPIYQDSEGKTNGRRYTKHLPKLSTNGISRQSSKSGPIYQNSEGKMKGSNHSKHLPELSTNAASWQTSKSGPIYQNGIGQSRSNSVDMLFDSSETVHRTPSSSQPQNNKVEAERTTASKFGESKFSSLDDDRVPDSPPYFDEELDVDSVAAASAAAVKKAIEEAQAKLKIAKEIMERRKVGLQNHVKLKKRCSGNAEGRREDKSLNERNKLRENEVRGAREEMDTPGLIFSKNVEHISVQAGNVISNFRDSEDLLAAGDRASTGAFCTTVNSTQPDAGPGKANNCEVNLEKNESKMKQQVNVNEPGEERVSRKTIEAEEEPPKQGVVARILDAVKWAYELKDQVNKSESSVEVHHQEEYNPKEGETEEELRAVHELEACEGKIEDDQKSRIIQMEEETGEGIALRYAESEQVFTQHAEETEEDVTSHQLQACEEKMVDNQKLSVAQLEEETKQELKKMYEAAEDERNPEISEPMVYGISNAFNDGQGCGGNEEQPKEAHKLEENDIYSESNSEGGESERNLKEIARQEEDAVRQQAASETCKLEENKVEQDDVHIAEGSETKLRKIWEKNMPVEIFSDVHDTNESEESSEKDFELEENEELSPTEETSNIHPEIYQMNKIEDMHQELAAWVETENVLGEVDQLAEDETEVTEEDPHCHGNNLASMNVKDELEKLNCGMEFAEHEENIECEAAASEVHSHEVDDEMREMHKASLECQQNINKSKEVETADVLEEMGLPETDRFTEGFLEVDDFEKQVEDETENLDSDNTDMNFVQKQHSRWAEDSEVVRDEGNSMSFGAEENYEDVEDANISVIPKTESEVEFSSEDGDAGQRRMKEEAQLPNTSEGKVDSAEIPHEIEETSSTENNVEDKQEILKMEVKESVDSQEKEVELKKDHLRKMDKEKERLREKEERIAVGRAVREARERAFAEARERAATERTAAEVRKRTIAEGKKTSANDQSAAEKASIEAKRKAERAAVERATVEARERALEKALSEKAALQARNNKTKNNTSSNDSQYGKSGSRCHNSSDQKERFDGANSEPTELSKARLERHQRTAERAAKALEEKNKRDLKAQKEQAERDRLADTLDVEIKRWSSGKERNLRALLSTLQNILVPNSGWQPVPLTDLISTTAVRKTYLKATLVVHPDKLQQRGATIQQKYICEKVFDLLKDAWNKFSRDER